MNQRIFWWTNSFRRACISSRARQRSVSLGLLCGSVYAERPVFTDAEVEHRPENPPDKSRSTGIPDRDADERSRFCRTGWESERELFFRLQRADREYQNGAEYSDERSESAAFQYGANSDEENSPLRMDLDYSGDLVRGAVQFGRAVEQMMDDAPVHDGTTMSPQIDSKRRKKLRQKKTALGHAEDDHEDWAMEQKM